jgi:hypothetical protein
VIDRIARRDRIWQGLALLLVALFLASIAQFYHPAFGFTALIAFPAGDGSELPALTATPHLEYPGQYTYDGQFYAQLALDPLLRDPAIDRALDHPPYRARRILFSWTAWLAGLGRPAWILQAFALQNVVCWLALAWLLTRWLPPRTGRTFALWAACLFSHGLVWSVRFSLLDGPSLLLLALAAAAAERQHTWRAGAILGAAALGRETNLLGAAVFQLPQRRRDWLRLAGALVLTILPLLIWQDYLWSIYRSTSLAGGDQLTRPFGAWLANWRLSLGLVWRDGFSSPGTRSLAVVLSLTVQLVFVLWSREWRTPWWRLAAVYAGLMLVVHPVVWDGFPGAITRVVLPLTVGFNILLARGPTAFWAWYVLGNLHLLPARQLLPIFSSMP